MPTKTQKHKNKDNTIGNTLMNMNVCVGGGGWTVDGGRWTMCGATTSAAPFLCHTAWWSKSNLICTKSQQAGSAGVHRVHSITAHTYKNSFHGSKSTIFQFLYNWLFQRLTQLALQLLVRRVQGCVRESKSRHTTIHHRCCSIASYVVSNCVQVCIRCHSTPPLWHSNPISCDSNSLSATQLEFLSMLVVFYI